jgi:hypothetical protein
MAITRAQQAKQMLREGGRLGYRFGGGYRGSYDSPAQSFTDSVPSSSYDSPAQSFTDSVPSSSYDAPTGAVDDKFGDSGRRDIFEARTTNLTGYDEETGVNTPPEFTFVGGGGDGVLTVNDLNTLYRTGVPESNFPGVIGMGLNLTKPLRDKTLRVNIDYFRGLQNIDRSMYPQTVEGYTQYMKDRSAGVIDAAGNPKTRFDDDPKSDFTSVDTAGDGLGGSALPEQPGEGDDEFRLARAFRADGGPIGGIMDLESGRQMYFLGKLVKKATRAVKKIVKSPIGKAALLYAGGTYLGGLKAFGGAGLGSGTFLSNLGSGQGIANLGGFLKGKLFDSATTKPGTDSKGLFSKILGNPMEAITVASLAAGLTAEQEDEAQLLADNTGIDIEAARNQILNAAKNQDDFRARAFKADGGIMRLGYQEGSKEPVAKKTMPLLDMGGKEMDLREDGGFVPIGRMEKADDVPARLSKNEFVFTADAVRNAGDGNVDKGAEVMYNMMKNLESGGDVSEESQGLEGARRMFQTSKRLEEVL